MKTWLLPFLACIAALTAAEQGSPDVIRWTEKKVEAKVVETGRLEIFDRKPAGKADSATFADRVAEPGKRFLWEPSVDRRRGAGGANIPDAAISEDRSALLLLETVGADEGPFDTRLVVIDLRSGEIVRVTRLNRKDQHFVKLLTIPGSDDILLFSAPEKKRQTILRIHPKGTVRGAGEFDAVSDAIIHAGKLLLKDQDKPELTCRSLEDLSSESTFTTAAPGGFLLPESENTVCNVVPGAPAKIERIALDGRSIPPEERFLTLPADAHPAAGLQFGGDTKMQLYLTPDGPAVLRIGNSLHRLGERVSGLAAYHQPSGTLFLGLRKNDMVAEFQPEKSTSRLRSSATGRLNPRTRGESRWYFSDNAQIPSVLVVDHRTNVYRMQVPTKGRFWKKFLLYTPGE